MSETSSSEPGSASSSASSSPSSKDLLGLYGAASDWAAGKVAGAGDLDARTPCGDWSLRQLLDHMLETQHYFAGSARGADVSPPGQHPPALLSEDPRADFALARSEVLDAFGQDGVVDKTGPVLGIAFADALLHGWDVARATGQDDTMPDGLAEAAYGAIHGQFSDDQRQGVFGPEIEVAPDASPQERLLAYTGRRS